MTNVQKENGFTAIANELLEVVMNQKFNGTQFKIIMAVWRYTYGFQRKEHEMSLNFISNATGVHKQTVKTELEKLIERNIITVVKESTYSSSRVLSFNKHYSKWKDLQSVKSLTVSKKNNTTVSEPTYTTVSESTYQERNIKENIKETTTSGVNPFTFYEQNIGMLTPVIIQSIDEWSNHLSNELVVESLKIAIKQNVRRFSYAEGILKKWKHNNVNSLNDVQALEGESQSNKPQKTREQIEHERMLAEMGME